MSNPSHKVHTIEITLSPSVLGNPGRVLFAAKLGQTAPQSALYTNNLPLKTAIDDLVKAGLALDAAGTAKETAKQAYFKAIGTEVAAQSAYDTCAGVLRAAIPVYCKTPQDLESLGGAQKVKGTPVPLVAPVLVMARPDKEAGSIYAHARRIPGLTRYILAISVDPITATSFEEQQGATAIRRLTGLVSGKLYWLRYCTERGSQRSAWSVPISVTAR